MYNSVSNSYCVHPPPPPQHAVNLSVVPLDLNLKQMRRMIERDSTYRERIKGD